MHMHGSQFLRIKSFTLLWKKFSKGIFLKQIKKAIKDI